MKKLIDEHLNAHTERTLSVFASFCEALHYSIATIQEKDKRPLSVLPSSTWLKPMLDKFKDSDQRLAVFDGMISTGRCDFHLKRTMILNYRWALTAKEFSEFQFKYLAEEDPELVMVIITPVGITGSVWIKRS